VDTENEMICERSMKVEREKVVDFFNIIIPILWWNVDNCLSLKS